MDKDYYKKIEIWGDLTITVTDFAEDEGEPILGVLITSHDPEDGNNGGSFSTPNCIYVNEEELPKLIKALQEFI